MNPLAKIVAPFSRAINAMIDGMPRRTVEMLRQTYIFIIVILCIAGAVIGYKKGSHSAKKTGFQMAETTNSIFDIDILQQREGGSFGAILDNELESGLDMKDPEKKRMPANEKLAAEDTVRIAEPEKDRHIKTGPEVSDKNDLASPERMNDKESKASGSRTLQRKTESQSAEISDKKISPLIEEPSKSGDIRGEKPLPGKKNDSKKLKPIDKKGGLSE